jgi:putative nucleotidyltransferase with HDIG domain
LANNRELLRKLAGTKDLPSLPQVVSLFLAKAKEKRSSAVDVAEILAEDPAMTAHILRVANSVLFNPTIKKITSVQQAIARIGFVEAQRVIIAIGVIDLFQKSRIPFDYRRFWRHCIATALFSEIIARRVVGTTPDAPEPDSCFVGGLLHDIGILPLAQHLGDRYGRLVQTAEKQKKIFEVFERERLGVSHQEVGAELMRRWSLSDQLAAGAEHHHEPEHAIELHTMFCRVIHVAEWLADDHDHSFLPNQQAVPIREEIWCKLVLSASDVSDLKDEFDAVSEDSALLHLFE